MRILGAIFDMDGTLLDSMHIWDTVAAEYLRSRGAVPRDELHGILGHMTPGEAAAYINKEYFPAISADEILLGIFDTVERMYRAVEPKPGVRELLERFRAAGIRMAVATLTDRPEVERTLGRLRLLGYFDAVLTCAEVGEPKTSPRIYEEALAALGTPREATPVFEDAYYAVRTAYDAGFPVVAVYDPSPECAFSRASALATVAVRDYRTVDWSALLGEENA